MGYIVYYTSTVMQKKKIKATSKNA
jgi:hypothetical protein